MKIFSGELMADAAARLVEDPDFGYHSRALSGTITFEDGESAAYITFFQGKIVKTGEGYNEFGSEFYLTASASNWDQAFRGDARKGIYELNGSLLQMKGNIFVWGGNIKAFSGVWKAVREAYLEHN